METKGMQMEWVGYLGKAVESLLNDIKGIMPEDTYSHLRASRKEMLLAIRSVLDREIARAEGERKPEARKVEVQ
jgi:hypothetical protein